MSIPVMETRRTSTIQKEGVFRTIGTGVMLLAGFLVGVLHVLALPFIIARDKSFKARVERKHEREAMRQGRRIAHKQSMGVQDPMIKA